MRIPRKRRLSTLDPCMEVDNTAEISTDPINQSAPSTSDPALPQTPQIFDQKQDFYIAHRLKSIDPNSFADFYDSKPFSTANLYSTDLGSEAFSVMEAPQSGNKQSGTVPAALRDENFNVLSWQLPESQHANQEVQPQSFQLNTLPFKPNNTRLSQIPPSIYPERLRTPNVPNHDDDNDEMSNFTSEDLEISEEILRGRKFSEARRNAVADIWEGMKNLQLKSRSMSAHDGFPNNYELNRKRKRKVEL